jgi:hypothetical protein
MLSWLRRLDELLRVFPFGVDVIVDTRSIKPGDDFRLVLDKKLDSSDILLILFTDQPKASHSYTGYEVGYFSRFRAQNRFITKNIERAIIPFCIGRQFPDTAESWLKTLRVFAVLVPYR